ncbi:MAG: DUF4124 domain-containing protein [Gammaproteobacteria bacterium]|nr:DUF4124 domain-containing protein [Gammaproteobacteria bacterium]
MKFKILSMLIILGLLSVLPMIYMGKFDPMALIDSGLKFDVGFNGSGNSAVKNLSNVVTDEKVHVYKWRDQNGIMQFSSEPPPTVTDAEQVVLDPNSNLMQAVKVPEKEEPKAVAEAVAPNPYTIRGMKKVMDDAKSVEAVLQKRHEEQQKMMGDL